MLMMRHAAYNVETGEILNTTTGTDLKRAVETAKAINVRYGFPVGKWIFCHDYGKKWEQRWKQGNFPC